MRHAACGLRSTQSGADIPAGAAMVLHVPSILSVFSLNVPVSLPRGKRRRQGPEDVEDAGDMETVKDQHWLQQA